MTARMWTWWDLASCAALAVLASGAPAQTTKAQAQVAAIVNGQPITMAEVENVLKMRPPMPMQPTQAQHRQLEMAALDFLIDERIMQQFMRQHGPHIDPGEINKQMVQLQNALKRQHKTLQDYYKETGLNEAQLRINILNWLQKEGYIRARLTEDYLRSYYEANRDFFDHVTVQASHIVLRLSPRASPQEREVARAKLQALRQQIVSGQITFAEAAKKYSQCTSAAKGGDLGSVPRKWVVDEAFAQAAYALKEGEISDIVQTDYGLHLIKVTQRKREGPPSTFERVKEDVRETAAEEMLGNLLTEQRKCAHIELKLNTDVPAGTARQ